MKVKSTNRTISWHINNDFRDYAIYTLQSRGIPIFDDALTNVQRIIVKNAKNTIEKTLSLVGSCISDNYDHGDSSLAGAIAKITQEFNCAENILEGKGFWGSPVVQEAAAPRYTSVKMNSNMQPYFKYKHLDEKLDDVWLPLHLELPIGLSTMTMGIAVGYKSVILPRKISDIERFMEGKLKTVKPYFKNFSGTVKKHKEGWLLKGVYTHDESKRTIHITDVPHLTKYSNFLTRLEKDIERNELNCQIKNDSAKVIDLKIVYEKGTAEQVLKLVDRNISLIVNENIVFVKDRSVITYKNIEDYLNDFKIRVLEVKTKEIKYQFEKESFNLKYEKAKKEFLEFMMEKKRNRDEVVKFLKKFEQKISIKLDTIKLSNLNNETLHETVLEIKRLESLTKSLSKESKTKQNEYEEAAKTFTFSGTISTAKEHSLFEDEEQEENGIQIFTVSEDDEFDENEI